jgi:LPXTG-motif cell wall-anchored protein
MYRKLKSFKKGEEEISVSIPMSNRPKNAKEKGRGMKRKALSVLLAMLLALLPASAAFAAEEDLSTEIVAPAAAPDQEPAPTEEAEVEEVIESDVEVIALVQDVTTSEEELAAIPAEEVAEASQEDIAKPETVQEAVEAKALVPLADTTPPVLSGGKFEWVYNDGVQRDVATFTFTTSEDGWLFIDTVAHGSAAPDLSYISGISNPTDPVSAGITTFQNYMYLSGSPAMDYYVSVRDAAGNVSQPLVISTVTAAPADYFQVSDSPFATDTWQLYCDVYDLVGANAVTISITYPYAGGSLVDYSGGFYDATLDTSTILSMSEASGTITTNIAGLAVTNNDKFFAGVTWSKSFAGQATITVAVDGADRYTTAVTGVLPIPQPSSTKDITSFVIDGIDGTINGTDIDVTVPYGTDVTNLEPAISHNGVSISLNGPQDFTNPVSYTVTAEDATTQVYTVKVTVAAPATTKDITSFKLAGVNGVINGSDIAVEVPYGTDLTALTPTVTHSGISVAPGGAQDFTAPVVYTVAAQDSSTKDYTVTVSVSTTIPVIVDFGTWKGTGTATAEVDADFTKFVQLTLDGKVVDTASYSVGGSVITLSEGYLKSLANGSYTFTAEFTDGSATLPLTVDVQTTGTVTPPPTSGTTPATSGLPKTGDAGTAIAALVAMLFAGVGVTLLARKLRKN